MLWLAEATDYKMETDLVNEDVANFSLHKEPMTFWDLDDKSYQNRDEKKESRRNYWTHAER